MTNKPGFVFDTNALVSAILFKDSAPRRAFDKAFEIGEILISLDVITELNDVLSRKKFNKYVSEEERIEFLVVLLHDVVFVEVTEKITECRNPSDDKFIELAVGGNAKYIITGDRDLLEMNPFRNIAMVTPRDFLELI